MYRHILSGLQNQGRITAEGRPMQPQLPEGLASTFPLSILIAEDNVINQQAILYILQKLGYDPVIVENGKQAVDAALNIGYVDKPVIIALTANAMEGDEAECLQAGMNDYIGKPVKVDELLGKLRKWTLHRKLS